MRTAYFSTVTGFEELDDDIQHVLSLIAVKPSNEAAGILVQFVASIVHPDFVCNLAMMDKLPAQAKEAAVRMFQYCLKTGLSIEEQGAILAFVQPYIVSLLGGKPSH